MTSNRWMKEENSHTRDPLMDHERNSLLYIFFLCSRGFDDESSATGLRRVWMLSKEEHNVFHNSKKKGKKIIKRNPLSLSHSSSTRVRESRNFLSTIVSDHCLKITNCCSAVQSIDHTIEMSFSARSCFCAGPYHNTHNRARLHFFFYFGNLIVG